MRTCRVVSGNEISALSYLTLLLYRLSGWSTTFEIIYTFRTGEACNGICRSSPGSSHEFVGGVCVCVCVCVCVGRTRDARSRGRRGRINAANKQ